MDIVNPAIESYMREIVPDDDPVLLDMEALAEERGFPIIGRLCGRTLEVLGRAVGATRVFEMGSGYGYSAYWWARATGAAGEIHLTDTDPDNEAKAHQFLERAGVWDAVSFHVQDAFDALDEVDGEFDVVYCDIDKGGYPEAWRRGRERVRVGGLYVCDNMLWSGRVLDGESGEEPGEGPPAAWTQAIDETNRAIGADPDFRSTIVPTRDGVVMAIRIR